MVGSRPSSPCSYLRQQFARASAADPADRYSSVDALADDVKAWRDGKVVTARHGGKRYIIGKFITRHRVAVTASLFALSLLIGALVATLIANSRAEAARADAERRFGDLRSLAGFMVFDLNDNLARTVGNASARKSLVEKAQVYLLGLAATPDASADIKLEAARGLISLAHIQGVPGGPNFGDRALAQNNLDAAIAQLQSPVISPVTGAADLAAAFSARAMIEAHADADTKKAKASLAQAETALSRVAIGTQTERWRLAQAGIRLTQLDLATLDQELPKITVLVDQLKREIDRWPPSERQSRHARKHRALADYYESVRAYFTDELDRSFSYAKAAQRQFQALDAELPNNPQMLYHYMWSTYYGYGAASGLPAKTLDADVFLQTTRRTVDRLLALEPYDRSLHAFKASLTAAEAQSLATKGQFRDAEEMQRRVIDFYRDLLGKDRKVSELSRLAIAYFVLGNIGVRGENQTLACASYRDSGTMLAELDRAERTLVGSVTRIRGFVDRNLQRCARSAPLSGFELESD